MLILALETSCDDTCCALLEAGRTGFRILSNVVSSQIKTHAPYGGVVPSLAAREHAKNIIPCLQEALKKSRSENIDLIALTIGPGLAPALLVGVSAAKALSYAWQKPLVGINHLEGHIAANFIGRNSKFYIPNSNDVQFQNYGQIQFPAICLVVSGGHTMLVLMRDYGHYQVLGQTRDDAAGECFDKVARILGLGYPGGPAIAEAAKFSMFYSQFSIELPRPMLKTQDYDFSFSGLKTAVLYQVKNQPYKTQQSKNYIQSMCVEVQQAVVDVLVTKTIKAVQEFQTKTVLLAGGVAANQHLRQTFKHRLNFFPNKVNLFLPAPQFCTDNALMIALAAYLRVRKRRELLFERYPWQRIKPDSNLCLSSWLNH